MRAYSTIVNELDVSIPLRYMYYPVFLLRRVLFVIILVLFANSPKIQIGVMSASAIFMIVYVTVIKPQKEKIMLILTASGEGILLVIHVIQIAYLNPDLAVGTSTLLGWLTVVLVGVYILVNWVVVIVITIFDLIRKYRLRQKIKNEKKL
jgi:hypothetical protein